MLFSAKSMPADATIPRSKKIKEDKTVSIDNVSKLEIKRYLLGGHSVTSPVVTVTFSCLFSRPFS